MSKEITPDNWLELEGVMTPYVKLLSNGSMDLARGQDWLDLILAPRLLASVPQEIHGLFEAARGALIYGCFYYPLYSLGVRELYRVAEAAVAHKYNESNGPPSTRTLGPTFREYIQWLDSQGVLQLTEWEKMPDARNIASHSKESAIITPPMAVQVMEKITKMINSLYPARIS